MASKSDTRKALTTSNGGKGQSVSAFCDAADANAQLTRKTAELSAINNGVPVTPPKDGGESLIASIAEYLEETKLTKKPKTLSAYSTALAYFQESCHKMNVSDIDRKDLLKFIVFLRDEKGQSPRSVYNKFESVMTFLKTQGAGGQERLAPLCGRRT
jgi:hypothetical protein